MEKECWFRFEHLLLAVGMVAAYAIGRRKRGE
jgi:hypothetical protein